MMMTAKIIEIASEFKSILLHIESITLNALSFGWIFLDVTLDAIGDIPTWVTVLIGLSIVFLNIARGISALRGKKKQ